MSEENKNANTIFKVWKKHHDEKHPGLNKLQKFNRNVLVGSICAISLTSGIGFGLVFKDGGVLNSSQNSTYIVQEGVVQANDFVFIDYVFLQANDGLTTTPQRNHMFNMTNSTLSLHPDRDTGLKSQLLGMKLKETKDVSVTFPSTSTDRGGKTYTARIIVKFILKNQEDKTGSKILATNDVAIFDYEGYVGGLQFQGGTAKKQTLTIGSGQFIPGFEDGMIGMKTGERRDVVVTFPANYQTTELAGKEATFKVYLRHVVEPTDLA